MVAHGSRRLQKPIYIPNGSSLKGSRAQLQGCLTHSVIVPSVARGRLNLTTVDPARKFRLAAGSKDATLLDPILTLDAAFEVELL